MIFSKDICCVTHLSIKSTVTLGTNFAVGCSTNHRKATFIGVVRHEVKRSAGKSGFMGNAWSLEHAANCIQFRKLGGGAD